MAVDEPIVDDPDLKKTTYGTGLLKGLGITMRHLLSRSVTIQYPGEKDTLPARSRGVIALKTENCTVCMLCARECPDWCIYIEGHKESRQPAVEGKRAKKFNVLDRFAIDYALCMYCGICVEVCPYDALFWSPEYEYSEYDIVELTHEIDRLNNWMYKVLPPVPLEEGATGPEFKVAPAAPAPSAAAPGPASDAGARPAQPLDSRARVPDESAGSGTAAAGAPEDGPSAAGKLVPPRDEEGTPTTPAAEGRLTAEAAESVAVQEGQATSEATVPASQGVSAEEAAAVRQRVYEEEMAKGSDPRVAEGRAKAAEMRALKGTKGPG